MAGTTTSICILNRVSIDMSMHIHRDAIFLSTPEQIKPILDEDDSHSIQFRESCYCEQRKAMQHISRGTIQLLNTIFSMVEKLKQAPEDTRIKFIELVEYVDKDGDTQLNILLCNIESYWNELLGQIAGCVFLKPCKILLNRANLVGQTPLIVAVQSDPAYPDLVRVLVLLGADPDKCDDSKNNARSYVRQTGQRELLAAIEEITQEEFLELKALAQPFGLELPF